MKYLLDTNVLSEIRKPNGDAKVKGFINKLREEDLYITTLSIGEIAFGAEMLQAGPMKTELQIWLTQKLPERFAGRIISPDTDVMIEWGGLKARAGKTLPVIDCLIAASALARRLTVVTRNVKDFEKIEGLVLINPWKEIQTIT